MKLVLTGIQGAGKSTQGNLLVKQLRLPYLSTGHIFREIAKEKTELGRHVKVLLSSGILIPDETTIQIVNDYLSRPEYKKGYILDGFPRTLTQAKMFHNHVDKVISLEIPQKEALWRLAHRADDDRDDNTIQALNKRIDMFNKHTTPVLEYYKKKNKLVVIDGTQPVHEVNDEILKSLGKQIEKGEVKNWEQDEKSIIAIVGLPGAGKSEAAEFFKNMEIPIIYFGKKIVELAKKKYGKAEEKYERIVREEIRREHGLGALAIVNEKEIKKQLKTHNFIVIDGMRSWEEYLYLKKNVTNARLYIVAVHVDKHLRYARISKRSTRSNQYTEERDIAELINLNMGPTIAFADFLIKNNFSMTDLHDKLDQVYREIYFS